MSEIDTIKERLSITDIVSSYIELKKAGINFTARCPFHNEKTPSFYVSPERGTYKCFGCGEGGDIFSFVMYMDGLAFPEALKKLAAQAGVTLSQKSRSDSSQKISEEKQTLKAIMQQAQVFYAAALSKSASAQAYLKRRGIDAILIDKWNIGYAPGEWRMLKDHLMSLGYTEKDIERAGLIKSGDKGSVYDRFRDRIIFPLENIQGEPIAFSGRYIGSDDVPAKYLNSPETPLFRKSRELYGMSHAKQSIRKYDFACVVEGQIDLVMASSVFPNTVATSGTALTKEHLSLIKRFTDRVVFVFDGDSAGVLAAHKATMIALGLDMEVKIASLPDGKDPADVIVHDREAYKKIIADASLSFDFFTEYIAEKYSGREQTIMIEEKLFPLLQAVSNPLEQDRYIDHMSQKLGRSKEAINARISEQQSKESNQTIQTEKKQEIQENPKILERLAEFILWLKEQDKEELIPEISDDLLVLVDDSVKKVTLTEESRFRLENSFQTDILVQNEIQELIHRAAAKFKEYRLASLRKELQEAEKHGLDTKKQEILSSIQSLLHS